ncbi:MAG: RNA polymerase sigma factor [Pseudomonadota bacterium]
MTHKKNKNAKSAPSSHPSSPGVMVKTFLQNQLIIRKFLHRFTSNPHDIEDITQETILRALKAEKEQEVQEPRAFLFGIARNVARKNLEKKSTSIIDFIEDFGATEYISNEPSTEEILEGREKMKVFAEAVATLPTQCQKVFILKKVYGYSHQEISAQLGISVSTTEKHVALGLKRCGEFLDQRLHEENITLKNKTSMSRGAS